MLNIFVQFKNLNYLCTRNKHNALLLYEAGPFVYRLGRQVFILERGVRFPYGLQNKRKLKRI